MSHNAITGDAIRTKLGDAESQRRFNENFDRIFGKPSTVQVEPEGEEEARIHDSLDKVARAG